MPVVHKLCYHLALCITHDPFFDWASEEEAAADRESALNAHSVRHVWPALVRCVWPDR